MKKRNALDSLLGQLGNEGSVESTGRFTLAPEKLREKLAAFQFERPSQWILKIIQGLVAAEANYIQIKQSYHRIKIDYRLKTSAWTHDELRQAFFSPESGSNSSLKHLVPALWLISFHLKARWASTLQEDEFIISWSPDGLTSVKVPSQETCCLEIIYADVADRESTLSIWANQVGLDRPRAAAELSQELSSWAFACPIRLEIDGRRIDNLHLYPWTSPATTVGNLLTGQNTRHLVSIDWRESSEGATERPDRLRLPPGTRPIAQDRFIKCDAWQLLTTEPVAWIALLAIHVREILGTGPKCILPCSGPSVVNWVSHGVIVHQQKVLTDCGASCHLFVSALGLPHDLSGLKLVHSDPVIALHSSTAIQVGQWLQEQTIELQPDRGHQWGSVAVAASGVAAASVLLSGGGLAMAAGLLAKTAFLGVTAKVALSLAAEDSDPLEVAFQNELKKLAAEWLKHLELQNERKKSHKHR